MATYNETKTPYEFLVRWDKDGVISGAHVGFRIITKKDGAVIADTVEAVQPVAIGVQSGFPLAEMLALVESGITDQGAAFLAKVAESEAAKAASESAKSNAEAAIVEANAATTALTEANTRLKAAQDEAKALVEAE